MNVKIKKHFASSQIIIFGFAGAIILGTILLMLPISSASGNMTPFSDALFTSTSAVCVTGLVVHDTATHWSMFGQFIILLLIQVGGLGIVTLSVSMTMLAGKKIGLMQRSTLQDAISAPKVGGIVKLTGFILKSTFLIELGIRKINYYTYMAKAGGKAVAEAENKMFFHDVELAAIADMEEDVEKAMDIFVLK